MLNEERVKHMVKLASYESQVGAEEVRISMYEKKDYIRIQKTMAAIWVTVGYLLLVALLGIAYIPQLLEESSFTTLLFLLGGAVLIYILILIKSIVFTSRRCLKKYVAARRNVKQFVRDLDALEKMYEKEEL